MSPTSVVAYLVLFASAGFFVVLAALFLGRLLRPQAPSPEKLETYECGERTVGTSYVQFDLRFYVVALVFLIFDVEVAFFFPWATVFGKAARLSSPSAVVVQESAGGPTAAAELSPWAAEQMRQLGVRSPHAPVPAAGPAANATRIGASARQLARAAMVDIAVFFLVLMVGFAYVWSRGDLDWVRAIPRRPGGSTAEAVVEEGASVPTA